MVKLARLDLVVPPKAFFQLPQQLDVQPKNSFLRLILKDFIKFILPFQ
jgi:hypothetical protein